MRVFYQYTSQANMSTQIRITMYILAQAQPHEIHVTLSLKCSLGRPDAPTHLSWIMTMKACRSWATRPSQTWQKLSRAIASSSGKVSLLLWCWGCWSAVQGRKGKGASIHSWALGGLHVRKCTGVSLDGRTTSIMFLNIIMDVWLWCIFPGHSKYSMYFPRSFTVVKVAF